MPDNNHEQMNAQFPEADGGGGRSGRGPATHVPGRTEPGGVVPPYEGRREKADSDEESGRDDRGPSSSNVEMTSPKSKDTPGAGTASPADEQPAKDAPETRDDDPGVGPGHVKGTPAADDGGR
jgi:hypothetical protein